MSKARSHSHNGDGPLTGEKAVAPIPLDAVVRAYLEGQRTKIEAALAAARTERKDGEVSMVVQLNRALGQIEGRIASLEQQLADLDRQLETEAAPELEPAKEAEPVTVG